MHTVTLTKALNKNIGEGLLFKIEDKLNKQPSVYSIATACEKQCIHCNVNSQKLGRTRS